MSGGVKAAAGHLFCKKGENNLPGSHAASAARRESGAYRREGLYAPTED